MSCKLEYRGKFYSEEEGKLIMEEHYRIFDRLDDSTFTVKKGSKLYMAKYDKDKQNRLLGEVRRINKSYPKAVVKVGSDRRVSIDLRKVDKVFKDIVHAQERVKQNETEAHEFFDEEGNVIPTPKVVDLYQMRGSVNGKPIAELDAIMEGWLRKAGIPVQRVETIRNREGKEVNAVAKADFLAGVVRWIKNEAGTDTLTEESAHFLVELMGVEHPLIKRMLSDITKRPEYQEVREEYADVYAEDIDFKKEAIGKMIAQEAVSEFVNTPYKSWWQRVKNWILTKLGKIEVADIDKASDPYKEAAKMLLTQDVTELTKAAEQIHTSTDLFALKNVTQTQTEIVDKLKSTKAVLRDGTYVNEETDEEIKTRVSNLIEKYRRSQGIEYGDNPVPAYVGTVIHTYMEMLIEDAQKGGRKGHNQIAKEVMTKLEGSEIPTQYMTLDSRDYNSLKSGVKQLLKGINDRQADMNKENGTKGDAVLLTEQILHSDISDIAGTADLLVVYADGRVGVYDFKTFHYKVTHKKYDIDPIAPQKVTEWNMQLNNYKELLREAYGVTEFAESRVVPIGTKFYTENKKTQKKTPVKEISSIDMDNGSKTKAALEYIPLAGEKTGQANVDRAVSKLVGLRASMEAERRSAPFLQRKKIESKMKKLDKALKALRLKQDVTELLNTAFDLVKKVRKAMVVTDTGRADYLTPPRISEIIDELSVFDEIIKTTAGDLASALDEAKDVEGISKLEIDNVTAAMDVSGYINGTKQELLNTLNDRASEQAGEDLTEVGRARNYVQRLFYGAGDVDSPIFRRLTKLFTTARDEAENATYEAIAFIQGVDERMSEWAASKGMSKAEAFKKIINPKNKSLVSKVKSEFWEDYEKAQKKGDVAWLKANTKFLEDVYNQKLADHDAFFNDPLFDAATYFSTKKGKRETPKQFRLRLEKRVAEEREKFRKRYDVRDSNTAYTTATKDILRPEPSDAYLSEEYKYIEANKPLKEYYEMYTSMNEIFGKKVGYSHKIGRNFIPHISQDAMERLKELGPGAGISGMWKAMLHSTMVREEDALLGKVDPATGERVKSVPLLFSDDIRVPIGKKDLAALEADLAQTYTKGTADYKNALDDAIRLKEYELGREVKSMDLTKSLILMTKSVFHYEAMTNIEDDVKALRHILTEGDVKETVLDQFGRTMKSEIDRSLHTRLGVSEDTITQFDETVDYLVYGRSQKGGFLISKDSKVAGNKVVQGLHKFLSVKALGLNPILGFASYMGAGANLHMIAAEGRMFSKEDMAEVSHSISAGPYGMLSKTEDDRGLLALIRPASRDLVYEEAEETSATWMSKNLTMRNVFAFHRVGDDNIDNRIALSMSNSHVIDSDGLVKHRDKATNKDAKSIRELTKTVDGKTFVEFEGQNYFKTNPAQFTKFRNKIRKVAFNVKGSTSEEYRGQINSTFLGQMFMKFRSWMPGLVQARISGMRYDSTLEQIEMGKFSLFMGEVFQNGLMPRLDVLGKMTLGLINSKFYTGNIDRAYTRKLMQEFFEENPHLRNKGLTEEDFLKLQEAKIKGTLAEVRMLLAFALIVAALDWGDWDDRDENSLFSRTAFLGMRRAFLEVSFFMNPASPMEIMQYPVPLMGVIQSVQQIFKNTVDEVSDSVVGENQKNDTTGYGYYTLKNVPLANQILALFAYFNPSRHETGSWRWADGQEEKNKKGS